MRKLSELTKKEQEKALNIRLSHIVNAVLYGSLLLEDELQDRVEEIRQESEENHTPWFAPEMILEDLNVGSAVRALAKEDLVNAYFPEPDDTVINLSDYSE